MARASKMPPVFDVVAKPLRVFLRMEAASGILLFAAAVVAMAWANSRFAASYFGLFATPLGASVGTSTAAFDVLALVNDGLMTVFFFLVGMEIKRELVRGELSSREAALMPAIAALGGMMVPGAIYFALNHDGPGRGGWGIPMATDIAFAVGCMSLLRARVQNGLVVFLTALAVFDDIGGILVIAFFYGGGLHLAWLGVALATTGALYVCNRWYVRSGVVWLLGGAVLWYALHHGGVHATIAGVVLGLMIPARGLSAPRDVLRALHAHVGAVVAKPADAEIERAELLAIEEKIEDLEAPLDRFVNLLRDVVVFGVMPLFAFANSGVSLAGMDRGDVASPIALGVALGLFAGKQVGVYATTILAAKVMRAPLPGNGTKPKLWGTSIVAGIGFTVALFIASLAFPDDARLLDQAKLGILCGSLLSAVVGYGVLRLTGRIAQAE
jgi:Na+:H+ antiporter, NhaA family